jgi:DNA polymerase-3 subunit beta
MAKRPNQAGAAGFRAELPAGVLAAAAARVAAIVLNKNTIPIVENALLRAGDGVLIVAATNLDQGLALTVDATAEGEATVPAAKLAAALARLDADAPVSLVLAESGQSVTISQGRSTFRLPALPASDWPDVMISPIGEGAETWTVDAAVLAGLVRQLEGAVNTSELRPALTGLFLDLSDRASALVATDGHVMGAADLSALAPPRMEGVVLPAPAFRPIVEIAKSADTVEICISARAVTVEAPGIRLRTKLIEAKFPEWRRILPAEMAVRVTVEADRLALAVHRAMLVTAEQLKDSKVKLGTAITLQIGLEEITVSARNSLGEEAADVVPCERTGGGEEVIRIETRAPYLAWAIASLGTDTIDIGIDDASKPIALAKHGDTAWSRIVETRRIQG